MADKKTGIAAFDAAFAANKKDDDKEVKFDDKEAELQTTEVVEEPTKAKKVEKKKIGKKNKAFQCTISIDSDTDALEEQLKEVLNEYNYKTKSDISFSRTALYKIGLEKFYNEYVNKLKSIK